MYTIEAESNKCNRKTCLASLNNNDDDDNNNTTTTNNKNNNNNNNDNNININNFTEDQEYQLIPTSWNLYNNIITQTKSSFYFGLSKYICFAEECYDLQPPKANLALIIKWITYKNILQSQR